LTARFQAQIWTLSIYSTDHSSRLIVTHL